MSVSAPRVLVVEHERETSLDRMSDLPGVDVRVVRPYAGEPLPDRSAADGPGWDGVLVLGGSMAAWEDAAAPWLPGVRTLLRSAVADGVPVLGICLGAQLLAMATGGEVRRGDAGPEVGVRPVVLGPDAAGDQLAARLSAVLAAPQGHRDAVTALPPGAVLLASSDRYPHQLFRVGPRAWGVQYHPEVSRGVFATWLEEHRSDLALEGSTPQDELRLFDDRDAELQASARVHAAAFADVVRSHASTRTQAGAAAPAR
ncbi:MAG TPA: type 1 glutamine amidotransferase [Mycobacteriales bacterium]|nr:type 1 glutamine amidotransferase [Mycobacteriales bacterium]